MAETNDGKHDRERNSDLVAAALTRQDIKYMRNDISEMKSELRDLKQFYVTKEQAATAHKDTENRIREVEARLGLVIKVGVAALLAFTTATATAIAKLIFKV